MQQLDQTGFSGYADCPNTVVWLTSHHSTSQHSALKRKNATNGWKKYNQAVDDFLASRKRPPLDEPFPGSLN
jgi:hypothetical protein